MARAEIYAFALSPAHHACAYDTCPALEGQISNAQRAGEPDAWEVPRLKQGVQAAHAEPVPAAKLVGGTVVKLLVADGTLVCAHDK